MYTNIIYCNMRNLFLQCIECSRTVSNRVILRNDKFSNEGCSFFSTEFYMKNHLAIEWSRITLWVTLYIWEQMELAKFKFTLNFLKNEGFNKKILFSFFDTFLHSASSHAGVNWSRDTLYVTLFVLRRRLFFCFDETWLSCSACINRRNSSHSREPYISRP